MLITCMEAWVDTNPQLLDIISIKAFLHLLYRAKVQTRLTSLCNRHTNAAATNPQMHLSWQSLASLINVNMQVYHIMG